MVQTKTFSKVISVNHVEKMLQHFENYNFIKTSNNVVQFGFLSESLQHFVKKEWLLSSLVGSDFPSFLFSALKAKENINTALDDVRGMVSTGPFSIIQVDNNKFENEDKVIPKSSNAMELVSNQFKKQTGTILRNQTFCSPGNAVEIFHKRQRDRKNWWRKFSALPGRFITTNVSNKENKSVVCEVQAEFPWGLETVETIKYLPVFPTREGNLEGNSAKRKKALQTISCEAILENITFTYLCDSYVKLNGNDNRDVLKFARALAPFKVAIAGSGSTGEIIKSLEEVSLLIAKQVRKLGFPVLLLPDSCTTSTERQVARNDALGVPYTLLLNDKTLQVGTVALRSRDTMLQEDSHVSLITEYLGKILK